MTDPVTEPIRAALELLNDVYRSHRDKDSPDSDWEYDRELQQWTTDEPCSWCQSAKLVIAALAAVPVPSTSPTSADSSYPVVDQQRLQPSVPNGGDSGASLPSSGSAVPSGQEQAGQPVDRLVETHARRAVLQVQSQGDDYTPTPEEANLLLNMRFILRAFAAAARPSSGSVEIAALPSGQEPPTYTGASIAADGWSGDTPPMWRAWKFLQLRMGDGDECAVCGAGDGQDHEPTDECGIVAELLHDARRLQSARLRNKPGSAEIAALRQALELAAAWRVQAALYLKSAPMWHGMGQQLNARAEQLESALAGIAPSPSQEPEK